MRAEARPNVVILLENAIPLVGVLAFGWSVAPVMVVYWIENGLIGLSTAAKLALACGEEAGGRRARRRGRGPGRRTRGRGSRAVEGPWPTAGEVARRLFNNLRFLVFYLVFWLVHGGFVYALFVLDRPFDGDPKLTTREVALAGVLVAATMAAAFYRDYLVPRAFEHATPEVLISVAGARLFVMHATVALGAAGVTLLGSPLPALVVLITLKSAFELAASWPPPTGGEAPDAALRKRRGGRPRRG